MGIIPILEKKTGSEMIKQTIKTFILRVIDYKNDV